MLTSKPVTPSTSTHTSLKDRPRLQFALRAAWVLVVAYILYVFAAGLSLSGMAQTNILRQIARVGLNLLTFSAIDIVSDIYILLGYFGLAILLFARRSDDWFAIFLSVMIMTFGVSVTNVGNSLAASAQFGASAQTDQGVTRDAVVQRVDHTARGVAAIQQRSRAAQHLHPLHHQRIEGHRVVKAQVRGIDRGTRVVQHPHAVAV